ncbi:hypothetical protein PtA15_14A255 [Puccinia triticina]|uniref:Uncharacterized protein n=1 Tax=Puccinia triticina TaxID=208348 RepID=A0ABY7D3W5_9BASI|nr:uncharacterized protein PtA15_14A255 [Puccinia triticina]WAQ91372.1 hypothetical protein PtA15_14A255 [Puccinia triticina]
MVSIFQERVWESLIALMLMDYSVESQEKVEAASDIIATVPASAKRAAKQMVPKDKDVKELFKKMGKEYTGAQWGKFRQACLGSLAVFLAFGPAGWWGACVDTNKCNSKSCYGLLRLARMKINHVKANPPNHEGGSLFSEKPVWANIEMLVYQCFAELQYHVQNRYVTALDWAKFMNGWIKRIDETAVYQAALIDMAHEIALPSKSLSWEGVPALPIPLPANLSAAPTEYRWNWEEVVMAAIGLSPQARPAILGPKPSDHTLATKRPEKSKKAAPKVVSASTQASPAD